MSDGEKRTLLTTLVASVLSLIGCGKPVAQLQKEIPEPTVVEEIKVTGFDSEGEPVIKKWSDGMIWIHFEAMPPFFAEDQGTEAEFEHFEQQIQNALKVPVTRNDREVFVIKTPLPDTVERAKQWLEAFHKPR